MALVSRGFHGKRRGNDGRTPPGQYLVDDFPVLSVGPTPRVDTDRWQFTISTEMGSKHQWSWLQMRALPEE
ncbi:MAG: sulfite oxidase-like oxidoreductase, partial [Rhodococcus sp. (in: high G+C Gram-positive bacteria)]